MMGETRPTTLVEYAAQHLRESILSGEIPAGSRIVLDALSEELKISPIPIREALRVLSTEGLVVNQARRGFSAAPLTVADLEQTYLLRLMLEPQAVRLAVPQLAATDVKRLERSLRCQEQASTDGDWESHRINHREFHFGIYQRSGSVWLVRFVEMLWGNAQRYQRTMTRLEGELEQRMREHHTILEACARADADGAQAAMRDHLEQAQRSLVEFLSHNDGVFDLDAPTSPMKRRSPGGRAQ